MRAFTLVMGTFNLEVEESEKREDGSKSYSAKCEKVGFSLERSCFIESFLFPFCKYLASKQLKHQWSPSKLIYRGSTLEISRQEHPSIYVGICKEIEFDDHDCLDELVDTFFEKVDKHLENTMKTFSVVYEGFTLEVSKRKVDNKLLYGGECKVLAGFYRENRYQDLNNLIELFQEKVDEYSKPTKIEYKGYELEIVRAKFDAFIGISNIQEGWKTEACTKEAVEKQFKKEVDEKNFLSSIRNLERLVILHQEELEEYLKSKGYKFDTLRFPWSSQVSFLYAIHPDYWDRWRWSSGYKDFPEDKVIFIKQK
jgi:hypothetical protein